MSKSNRIKGKFNEFLGCREESQERRLELESRIDGIYKPAVPTKSMKLFPRITKTQRKVSRKLQAPTNWQKQEKASSGFAKVMGLVVSTITTAEVSLV